MLFRIPMPPTGRAGDDVEWADGWRGNIEGGTDGESGEGGAGDGPQQ